MNTNSLLIVDARTGINNKNQRKVLDVEKILLSCHNHSEHVESNARCSNYATVFSWLSKRKIRGVYPRKVSQLSSYEEATS